MTWIAQSVICDALDAMECPFEKFEVNKALIKCVDMSCRLYKEELAKYKVRGMKISTK